MKCKNCGHEEEEHHLLHCHGNNCNCSCTKFEREDVCVNCDESHLITDHCFSDTLACLKCRKPKQKGCGKEFYNKIWQNFTCGQIEDLKHSDHILLCPSCSNNSPVAEVQGVKSEEIPQDKLGTNSQQKNITQGWKRPSADNFNLSEEIQKIVNFHMAHNMGQIHVSEFHKEMWRLNKKFIKRLRGVGRIYEDEFGNDEWITFRLSDFNKLAGKELSR